MRTRFPFLMVVVCVLCSTGWAQIADYAGLSRLTPGRVGLKNGLWVEVPVAERFDSSKTVVIADLKGPGIITMIHFALSREVMRGQYHLGRELMLRAYWDGEEAPGIDCPLVDFFCDPLGDRPLVNTALVNKRQGYNAYFPMPFRKSAKIVLVYTGSEKPGAQLRNMMPAYSYVMYRLVKNIAADEGYFHAQWRQATVLMGKEDYVALEAKGPGKFIGWHVHVRQSKSGDRTVDMNEKFYIDGEPEASVEFQGIEDSMGSSWGFPGNENFFPLAGFWKCGEKEKDYVIYRFFVNDAISFESSLRIAIGFGKNEQPKFPEKFSKPGSDLPISSTCYWYGVHPGPASQAE